MKQGKKLVQRLALNAPSDESLKALGRWSFVVLSAWAAQSAPAMAQNFNTLCTAGTTCSFTGAVATWQYAMTCTNNNVMTIQSASYGTSTASRSCQTYIASRCSGKSSCMFTFSNENCGGDPAPSGSKTGSAVVKCGTTVTSTAPTPTPTSTPTATPAPTSSSSPTSGLKAQMYANMALSGSPSVTRTVSQVNFALGNGSPDPAIPVDRFSMRLTGSFVANQTGTHVFYVSMDDGARVTFNGQQYVNDWTDGAVRTQQFSVSLVSGKSYPISIDYYENGGLSDLKLEYSTSATARTVVPSARLTPTVSATTPAPAPTATPTPTPTPTATPTSVPTSVPASGVISINGNKFYDSAGVPFVARGPENVMARAEQTADVDQAAALGANAMRMLLTVDEVNGMTPAHFDSFLARAVANKMVVWVSLFTWDNNRGNPIGEALGGGNFYSLQAPAGTSRCSRETPASCYLAIWQRPWAKNLIAKYRANVIIDAGQEFIGLQQPDSAAARLEWADSARMAVKFFRAQGYTSPLEFLSNFQGRDLYAIVEHGNAIRAVDSVKVNGQPQTFFGWQAYWGTSDGWYRSWQGGLLRGSSITASEALRDFAMKQPFPIQAGFDNYAGDTNTEYRELIDQSAAVGASWLWWVWTGGSGAVECPVSGSTCQNYVARSQNGFAGAKKLTR